MKHGILRDNIHYWYSTSNKWLLSFEDSKQLFSFDSKDDLINYLYLSGFPYQANQIHSGR